MTKICFALIALAAFSGSAAAQYGIQAPKSGTGTYGTGSNPNSVYVAPHTNPNGTYVPGYNRTAPNATQTDNYGAKGNVNPYTGAVGTRTPYK